MIDKAKLDEAGKALSTLEPLGKREPNATQSNDPTTKHVKSSNELWVSILEKVRIFASLVEKIGDVR